MTEELRDKWCPRCGRLNVRNGFYCCNCGYKFETKSASILEGKSDKGESWLGTSAEINDLAKKITREFSLESKDKLLKRLPSEYKDRVVEGIFRDILLLFARDPKTFVAFARKTAQEYERTNLKRGQEIPEWLKQWRQLERELNIS